MDGGRTEVLSKKNTKCKIDPRRGRKHKEEGENINRTIRMEKTQKKMAITVGFMNEVTFLWQKTL